MSDRDYHLKDVPSYGEQNPLMGINAQFPLESGHQPRIQGLSDRQQGRDRAVLNHCNPAIFMIYWRKRSRLRWQIDQAVGNAHGKYELDMLFVFRIPNVKSLTVLSLKQATIISLPREWAGVARFPIPPTLH